MLYGSVITSSSHVVCIAVLIYHRWYAVVLPYHPPRVCVILSLCEGGAVVLSHVLYTATPIPAATLVHPSVQLALRNTCKRTIYFD